VATLCARQQPPAWPGPHACAVLSCVCCA
jgi:hypothetical protein